MKRLLCRIGIHAWGETETHPFKGNWVTRQCRRCFKIQDRRLF